MSRAQPLPAPTCRDPWRGGRRPIGPFVLVALLLSVVLALTLEPELLHV